ncbi:MAG: diguanylate cyclase, partial [Clostridia bacterium]
MLGALVAILPKGSFCDLRVAFPRDMRWAIEIAHLRDYLELQQMHFSGRLQVTVSVGGHVQRVEDGVRWEDLLATADAALYEAKHDGR